MNKVQMLVQVGEYMEGIPNSIINSLTYDSIKPISIVGSFEMHSANCTVIMENNDTIEWNYKNDSQSDINTLIVNGNPINLLNEEDEDLFHDIRNYYRDYAINSNKVV